MKAAFYTLGCKVNQYETEYMSELLSKAGFEIVAPSKDADYYIINSCTVTATADKKTRQNVRKFKRKHPGSVVILTGCMPQAFPEQAEELEQADIVLTNKSNNEILDLINQHSCDKNRIVKIDKHAKGDEFADCSIAHFSERIRAFVKIEDGCDRFCSYCIIPTSRGRVRSKPLESLKNEVKTLGENGIKEIVLVGINLSSYGKGENFDMVDAVRVCAEDKNISRVRLGSLEPDHITDEVIEGLAAIDKFCPQFHISLQSGCDRTLKNMNRHYTAAEYRALCEKLREVFDDCTLTTDVMVGFHDETEQDFEESLAFVKSIRFEKVHTFPYSEREGTAASRKGDNVPKQIKEERAAAMIKLADEMRLDYLNSIIGSDVEVLFENEISHGIYQGYTKNYVPVRLKSDIDIIGKELTVTLTEVDAENDCVIASL
ncbi:MAG: tRNA (N(6)-L-threonylcarbamoyladenosine(37)-C(2))-methylthiotransferase MtaB [Eubacterium sp.]|nr:tRNA (N(6)-L-threonylcarbamoyladenosine(37)-C(2))-methylthiotransferase MtaB [Eubacterium sp.]